MREFFVSYQIQVEGKTIHGHAVFVRTGKLNAEAVSDLTKEIAKAVSLHPSVAVKDIPASCVAILFIRTLE